MYATHEAELDIPDLPPAARHVHIVPDLESATLISIGQLCDAGCAVVFDATKVTVTYQNCTVLTGTRTQATRLWELDITPPEQANHADTTNTYVEFAGAAVGSATPAELVAFTHAAMFSPALSTLEKALNKGYLHNLPGLTATTLRKHPPRSVAMAKGHLDQERKNKQSTKTTRSPSPAESPDDTFPDALNGGERTHHCYASVIETTGQVYTDLTGIFVVPSSRGSNYLFVLYDYDSNAILAEPINNRRAKTILDAYKTLHSKLCQAGIRPKLQRLDNECSASLQEFMTNNDIDFQLVPPGVHRRNAAERAIRTFQNHFIAGLCSLDKDFPLHLWDRLLPQAVMTLNLMRGSRLNPKLSAWAQLNGHFDFNRTPIAPPGTRVVVHEKPSPQRTTWSPHGLDGWYIGPALKSYRCYRIWMWDTRTERISDGSIAWFPTHVTMPLASTTDIITAGIHDIIDALKNPSPGSPLAPLTDSHVAALKQVTETLTATITQDPDATVPPTNSTCTSTPTATAPTPLLETPPASPTPQDESARAAPLRVEVINQPEVHNYDQNKPLDPNNAEATYTNRTGVKGRKHRARKRVAARRHHLNADEPSPPPITPKPATSRKPLTPAKTAKHTPRHHHGTRANQRIHRAAHAHTTKTEAPPLNTVLFDDHFALHGNAINPDTGHAADYNQLIKCSDGAHWIEANRAEFERLLPGGTDTMRFITYRDIPAHKKATYLRIVCADRPEKVETRRVRFTVGGDRIDYGGDVSTKTASLPTVKILLNSVISTEGGRFMTLDIKDYYLGTPLVDYEYMRIPIGAIPPAIFEKYNLAEKVQNGAIYVEIRKGMYGLPHAGKIANDRLTAFLEPHGYAPVPITPGLWRHKTRDIAFALVVDDFGVAYTNRSDAEHLRDTLKLQYAISEDWEGTRYCGLDIKWDYKKYTCDISLPGYIERLLRQIQHPRPRRPQHAPHAWQKPTYGAAQQFAPEPDDSPLLDVEDTKLVQQVIGALLYYARAIDSTMLPALSTVGQSQAKGTVATLKAVTQLLNYAATHPDAVVRFHRSDMALKTESDAAYLIAPKARSRAAGYHYLSSMPANPDIAPTDADPAPPMNGAVDVVCTVLREVLSSAAEAELAGLYHNGKAACPLRTCLEELGHPQPPTPITTDNSTATGIANDIIKQKRSKAIDMRFYWIRDRVRQGQFHVFWRRGTSNRADYFTKHHSPAHHQAIRSAYLHDPNKPSPSDNYFAALAEDEDNSHDTAN